ncbi:MAG: glycosyltransferase family 4 protein, partial [Chloroflexota bacterium]|nr:glycosyltransferase family 4 protein [Chloroflexota bacterium]
MRKDRAKQRIAILHYAAPPVIGGVEATIYHHARGLADLGYQVQVIVGRGEAFDDRVALRHIPEIDSKHSQVLTLKQDLDEGRVGEGFPPLQRRIAAALREALADVDTCIVHNAFTLHKNLPLTAALHQLAEEGCVRFIAWCHDLAWTNPLYRPQLRDRYPWNLLKKPLTGVRYVTVSRSRRRELAHLLGLSKEEIRVIPPGVEPSEFLGLTTATRRLAERLGLLRAEPLMLLPARLTRRKNIELALRVTAALKERGWAAKLIVTGPPGPHDVRNIAYLHRLEELRQRLGLSEGVIFLYECQDEDGERIEVSDAMMA